MLAKFPKAIKTETKKVILTRAKKGMRVISTTLEMLADLAEFGGSVYVIRYTTRALVNLTVP